VTDINQLSTSDTLTAGDLLPIWRANNSDTRKTSLTTLQAYMQANLSFPTVGQSQFVVQYAAPVATGFTVTLPSNSNNQWLIMSPVGAYATGTITFPPLANLADNQEILIVSSQAVTTLTLSGNGATVSGAPTGINANGTLRFKYNALGSVWYRIEDTTFGFASLSSAQTFSAQQTLTSGLVIQSATAAVIASAANAINTTNKVTGKVVYDTTNNRIMIASGSSAVSPWYIADGSASVTPS
jgi:hypothetical protein